MNATKNTGLEARSDYIYSAIFCVTAISMVALAFFQQYIMYNPVPVWDMLQGYLGFLEKLHNGDISAWLVPHNEHRIFFQRILFWIDNRVFHGTNVFLIVSNSVLIGANISLLCLIGLHERRKQLMLPLLVAWSFLLFQEENITWAFQGQFHQAYLVPLVGLYLLAVPREEINLARVAGVVIAGWLSVGTMGNGVVASPMFLALALILRQPRWSVALLFASTIVQFLVLHSFKASPPPSLIHAIAAQPVDFFRFFVRLIGSPFYYLFGKNDAFLQIELTGIIFLALLCAKALKILRNGQQAPRSWALVAFSCYVLISYAGATVSRLVIGIDAAFVPHYTTPAVLAWAAIALMYVDWIEKQFTVARRRIGFVAFAGIMLAFQFSHLNFSPKAYHELRVALLGMAMGVNDYLAIESLSDPRFVHETQGYVQPAYKANLGYLQNYPYRAIRDQLGSIAALEIPPAHCVMAPLERAATTDSQYSRFATSIEVSEEDAHYPRFVRLLNGSREQIGFGLVASRWVDRFVSPATHGKYRFHVEGYVTTPSLPSKVTVVAESFGKPLCQVAMNLQAPQFAAQIGPLRDLRATVDLMSVHDSENQRGSDFFRSDLSKLGLRVIGTSGQQGDADIGKIKMVLKPGDSFLYRSGPTAGHQIMTIQGKPDIMLPESVDWVQLTPHASMFEGKDQIEVAIEDRGTRWGEWSAIAVRDMDRRSIAGVVPKTETPKN
ncbi:hypothetical protein K2O51_16125 [Cupriavidus pinatubonensis]|uniref:hypothetical protein n=1 Tax=Cupriavidus pinatubonensis TaxID=248026 RepID=UPI001C737D10|nr:hypothetical protein [Cupriavidus pinatubonensis]QYY32315.1 hypothetical protein K2O51_16125 [Cupriavidus pinatubonensis]